MPTLNVPLVERIIQQLIDHPETHDQNMYGQRTACGTTQCVAGWAVLFSGKDLVWEEYGTNPGDAVAGRVYAAPGDVDSRDIDVIAAELLGIEAVPAKSLFYDMRDTHHIVARLKELINDAQAEQVTA